MQTYSIKCCYCPILKLIVPHTTPTTNSCASYISASTVKSGLVYVDIGCGDGYSTSAIAKLLKVPKENAFKFDIGESMGSIMKDDFQLVFFDGKYMSAIEIQSVDVLTMMHVLHHTGGNQDILLSEIARVLKPSGLFLMKEHDSPNSEYRFLFQCS